MNNRSGAKEKYCLKESMSADMKEGQLRLVKANGDYY